MTKKLSKFGSLLKKILFFSCLILTLIFPVKVSAIIKDLDFFSKNNILYYNPENCLPVSGNGIFSGAKYSFTDDELKRLWWAAESEQGSIGVDGIKTELSIFANVYENKGGEPGNPQGLIKAITRNYYSSGGWFASTTGEAYETGRVQSWHDKYSEPTSEEIAIARDILNNGNRTIPQGINEHDSLSDITSASNNGTSIDKNDRSQYKSGVTKIKNNSGSTYTFYMWANGKKECGDGEKCGDPFGYTGKAPQESYSTLTQANYNTKYDGTEILSKEVLQQIQNNKKTYQAAVSGTNIPWQLLAAIHYRESNAALRNPNSQGVYQIVSGEYEAGKDITEEEFLEQSKAAVEVIKSKAGSLDLSKEDNVKRVFFLYNGAAEAYKNKAINMGFTEAQANNGEGSPYVMNLYDEKRDPNSSNMSPFWPGRYVSDGQYDETSTEVRPGAFLVYKALGSNTTDVCANSFSSKGQLIAKTALDLSWDGLKGHYKNDPKPEYVSAMQEVGNYIKPNGYVPAGASCDQFVATVMRYSGADENFNLWGADNSGNYMASHPELYVEVKYDGTNPEVLQPGDIFATYNSSGHGHIWIYVEINGEMGRADASFDDRTALHYVIYGAPGITDQGGTRHYRVFRRLD